MKGGQRASASGLGFLEERTEGRAVAQRVELRAIGQG
jgi:hypothetical protein